MKSVEEFFSSVKMSATELEFVRERAKGYEKSILNAKRSGQKALLEQLEAGLNVHKMEGQCITVGLTKAVSEDSLVKFYKESKRGLRLDWIANFTRIIPEDLVTKKMRADEIGIFDNYAVLHYDPQMKSYSETQAEKNARLQEQRDPILFGLISGSRKLYVIGDWIDEKCGLTLDAIADAIGSSAIEKLI